FLHHDKTSEDAHATMQSADEDGVALALWYSGVQWDRLVSSLTAPVTPEPPGAVAVGSGALAHRSYGRLRHLCRIPSHTAQHSQSSLGTGLCVACPLG